MPSAKSTAAITVTHKPTTSRLIAVRQPFHSREVCMATEISRTKPKTPMPGAIDVYEGSTHLLSLAKSRYRFITVVARLPPLPYRLLFVR
jgi:hypothetical protein